MDFFQKVIGVASSPTAKKLGLVITSLSFCLIVHYNVVKGRKGAPIEFVVDKCVGEDDGKVKKKKLY